MQGLNFITIQTNSHERRRVSIAYSTKTPDVCNLLGNLEHQTEFKRADMVQFAKDVLKAFEVK